MLKLVSYVITMNLMKLKLYRMEFYAKATALAYVNRWHTQQGEAIASPTHFSHV